jgi:hypothetical protein
MANVKTVAVPKVLIARMRSYKVGPMQARASNINMTTIMAISALVII